MVEDAKFSFLDFLKKPILYCFSLTLPHVHEFLADGNAGKVAIYATNEIDYEAALKYFDGGGLDFYKMATPLFFWGSEKIKKGKLVSRARGLCNGRKAAVCVFVRNGAYEFYGGDFEIIHFKLNDSAIVALRAAIAIQQSDRIIDKAFCLLVAGVSVFSAPEMVSRSVSIFRSILKDYEKNGGASTWEMSILKNHIAYGEMFILTGKRKLRENHIYGLNSLNDSDWIAAGLEHLAYKFRDDVLKYLGSDQCRFHDDDPVFSIVGTIEGGPEFIWIRQQET